MKNRKKYPFCLVYTIKWLITYLDTSFDAETMRLEVINNEKLGKYVASKFENKTFLSPFHSTKYILQNFACAFAKKV